MPSWQQLMGWMENKGVYMAGRFVFGMALATAFASGGSILWPAAALFAGTTGLQLFNTWRRQSYVEADLLNTYRDEIAAKLGMSVEAVGIEQLHQVAYGDHTTKLGGNSVLQAELARSGKRMWMEIGTTMGAVVTSIAAFMVFAPFLEPVLKPAMDWAASVVTSSSIIPNILAPTSVERFGIMLASGTGMGVFNTVYDKAAARYLGYDAKSPTDIIRDLQRDVGREVYISQEQVFGVYAAALPTVASAVDAHFGKPFHELDEEQQYDALKIYGKNFPIAQLTLDINHGVMEPDELAFIAVGQTSGVARKTIEQVQAEAEIEEERTVAEKVIETAKELLGNDNNKENANPQKETALAATNFVERVGGKQPDADLSHVDRLMKDDAAIIDRLPTLR